MSGIRCQLCDGLILNGRCRTCGMPYRNDEVLYHLNENSRDHYKHATPKAQAMMRNSRVPLGDKASSNKGKTRPNLQNKNTQNRNNTVPDRMMSKEQIRAQQERVRQEAMAKINTTNVPKRNTTAKNQTKKKGIGWIWWVIILFYIIAGFLAR